jgi:hypothetical protein
MSMSGNRKLIKMSAIIEEETYLMTQLITDKDAKVAIHPSKEMLSEFMVGGYVHEFKRIITVKEMEVIRRLREVAIRKKNNEIQSNEEVISEEDVETLTDFLSSRDRGDKYQK